MAEKKPKILWANPYCMLDTSSGASITIRQILLELQKAGYEVEILGATIFDSPQGVTRLGRHWKEIQQSKKTTVIVNDGPLKHRLIKTRSTVRSEMRADEEARWYQSYVSLLNKHKPDVVLYYGGRTLDLLIGDEAHARGIPVAAFLYNGNFSGTRWCRDVDLILTDSHATANHYKKKDGLTVVPVGPFVDRHQVTSPRENPQNVLFINPSLAKGGMLVAQIAMYLEEERPDIQFEIVESRGNWGALTRTVSRKAGKERSSFSNVIVTPNTADIATVYKRAKIILIPSLWWESFPRVSIEALMNGITPVYTKRGGLFEAIGDAGIPISLPDRFYKAPYRELLSNSSLQDISSKVVKLIDNTAYRKQLESIAKKRSQALDSQTSLRNFLNALKSIIR